MSNETELKSQELAAPQPGTEGPVFAILITIGVCHMLTDLIAGTLPALYPIFKASYGLSFQQIGLITLTFQLTSSLLQPLVGLYTDRKPRPFSLVAGMGFTLIGLLALSRANTFELIVLSAMVVGAGSAIFHPESSRVARLASGGRPGLAQSIFQVGGNFGISLGPLLAALIVVRSGQRSIAWFSASPALEIILLSIVGLWYMRTGLRGMKARLSVGVKSSLPRSKVAWTLTVLLVLLFSKYVYLASLTSYLTFFLIGKFNVSVRNAQLHLFVFLASTAVGTFLGGPIGDRIGRKYVIWCSILGVLPFTLMLPYANLFWTGVLTVVIGLILSAAFAAIVVYGQELIPGKVGMVSGMFFGFAFGVAGVSAAMLGEVADLKGIDFVYRFCSVMPALGLLAYFLPDLEQKHLTRPESLLPAQTEETISG